MSDNAPTGFYGLSSALTGFAQIELHGSGVGGEYYDKLIEILGQDDVDELLDTWDGIAGKSNVRKAIQSKIWQDAKLGPIARNLVKMWYLSIWYPLPNAWREAYGRRDGDVEHVVSALAYKEGLVWRAISAHPQAAKQPGFGTWAEAPGYPAQLIARKRTAGGRR